MDLIQDPGNILAQDVGIFRRCSERDGTSWILMGTWEIFLGRRLFIEIIIDF